MSKHKNQAKTKQATATLENNNNSFISDEKLCLGLLVLLLLLVAYIRSKFVQMPFERDEGAYSLYGKMLLEGKTPYRDFYEQKFPGIFYFYALVVALFGDTVKGMHTGFIFINLSTITLLYFIVKKLFTPVAGIISAATFAITSLTPFLSGFTVQSEHGVVLIATIGILFYVLAIQKQKWYYYLLMGLTMGTAFMTKTTGLFFMAWGGVILIIDFFFEKEKNYKLFFRNLFLYGGGASVVILWLFLLIYLKGAFADMVFWTYDIPKHYVNKVPFEEGIKYFGYSKEAILHDYKFFWYQLFLAGAVCLFKAIPLKTKAFAVSIAAFSSLTIVPGFYFYGHYWIQLLPGLAILSGFAFYGLTQVLKTRFTIHENKTKYVYLSVFTLFFLSNIAINRSYYFKPNYYKILRTVYGNNPFPECMEIGKYINSHAKPEEGVALMGSEPQLYFYTHTEAASKHAYFSAVVDNLPEHRQWQREYVAGIEKQKPRYFIFFNHPISLLVQANTDRYVFEWANKYLTEHYKLVGLADMIDGGQTVYVWNEELMNYKPVANNRIYVYERVAGK
ncbi:MAG: glycosyltransferase family 39 protein [Bacteroidetes bacterium]|nr:glycosyltransferase family 39 protein [Bacteroidota bacterium]